jgi:hypothetical protein
MSVGISALTTWPVVEPDAASAPIGVSLSIYGAL